MNKTEIAPGIVVYRDVIEGHDSLINDIEDAAKLNAVTWMSASVKSGEEDGVDKTKRDTQTIGIAYSSTPTENLSTPGTAFQSILGMTFFNAFNPIERDYAVTYGINLPWHDSYSVLKYGVGQKFVNHIDDHQDFH